MLLNTYYQNGNGASGGSPGVNVPLVSEFPISISGDDNSIFEDHPSHMQVSYATQDGFGNAQIGRLETVAAGEMVVWRAQSRLPPSNYQSARLIFFNAAGARWEIGDVYDGGFKTGLTHFNTAGEYDGHSYLSESFYGAEYFRIYKGISDSLLTVQKSYDGTSWTTLNLIDFIPTSVAAAAKYVQTTVTPDQLVTLRLMSYLKTTAPT